MSTRSGDCMVWLSTADTDTPSGLVIDINIPSYGSVASSISYETRLSSYATFHPIRKRYRRYMRCEEIRQ